MNGYIGQDIMHYAEKDKNYVRYLGVVVKILDTGYYRVMLSMNSYESNRNMRPKVGNRHFNKNPTKDFTIDELVVFKKADVCLTE